MRDRDGRPLRGGWRWPSWLAALLATGCSLPDWTSRVRDATVAADGALDAPEHDAARELALDLLAEAADDRASAIDADVQGDAAEVMDASETALDLGAAETPEAAADGAIDPPTEVGADMGAPDVTSADVAADREDVACSTACDPGRCVDLRSDLEHCGRCDNRCPLRTRGAEPVCFSGACGERCPGGAALPAPGGACPLRYARLITPRPGSRMGTSRPGFAIACNGCGGVEGQIEFCADPACATVTRSLSLGTRPEIFLGEPMSPEAPLRAGWQFWRFRVFDGARMPLSTSPAWSIWIPGGMGADSIQQIRPWNHLHDLDGDGLGDFVVHAEGGVGTTLRVYLAQPTAPWAAERQVHTFPAVAVAGALMPARSIRFVRWAGDVDSDGRGDALVCIRYFQSAAAFVDRLLLLRGDVAGLRFDTPQELLRRAAPAEVVNASAVGDVDMDSFGDIAVATRVDTSNPILWEMYRGSATGVVSGAPYRELNVSLPAAQSFTGAIRWGGDREPDTEPQVLVEESPGGWRLWDCGTVTCVRRDMLRLPEGCHPEWIGAGWEADRRGRVLCTFTAGTASEASAHVYGGATLMTLGRVATVSDGRYDRMMSAASVGDTDGDGNDDFAVVARQSTSSYRLLVYRYTGRLLADLPLAAGTSLPRTLAAPMLLGDVNRDGWDDFLAGTQVFLGQSGGRPLAESATFNVDRIPW